MTLPPPDLTPERAVLGSVLVNPDASEITAWLPAVAFRARHHRLIWQAIIAALDAGLVADIITVMNELDQAGKLVEIGGMGYLTRLLTEFESSQHAESYARVVERNWRKRELLVGAEKLAALATGTAKGDARTVLSEIERTQAGRGGGTALGADEIAAEVWEAVAFPERMAARLVPTGLAAWDTTLGGGLERGTLAVIMARPGMGKTALLVQIADYVSEQGGTVAVFSKEMTARQWLLRTACRRSRVSVLSLRQGTATDEERQRVLVEVAALSERKNLIVDDSAPQTTEDVRAICDRLMRSGNLTLVLADHLRLFSDMGDNENKRQGNISWAFKRLAKGLDIPVVVAAQLNRQVEQGNEKKPDLKDLRDSGEIEENADTVTALYRDSYYTENPLNNVAELINRKARDGERNSRARFAFIARHMSFEQLAKGADRE